jgi:DNA-binding CsgD family transcriptional regulator
MISTVELSELLVDLYATPLQPKRWQMFFDRLCMLTNIASGIMVSIRPESNLILAGGGLNFDPEIVRLYNEHYGANDPYTEPTMRNNRVGVIQGDELVSHPDLLKTELYNDVLVRYDLAHMTLMSCESSTEAVSKFPLWSSAKNGPMDAASIHLLQTLIPHVQAALLLRAKIVASEASDLLSETALDAMSIAAILVTGRGQIRHMNRLAAGYLQGTDVQGADVQSADGLYLRQGRLVATDTSEDGRLQSLIAGASGEISGSLPGGAMKISRPRARTSLQVVVMPAPPQYHRFESSSLAVVFLIDPSSRPKARAALMRQLYGLTPAEARIADLLAGGNEVGEVAAKAGITVETARFHLKRVMAKTGVRRQTELVRLMLSLPGQ